MICPYRKKLEISEYCNGKIIEETYMECYKRHCPYYEADEEAAEHDLQPSGYCGKASKEIHG